MLYEDNHLLVAYKPFNLLTQPTDLEVDSLETRCKAWLKDKYQKPGAVFLHPIHRLDKPAAGIIVFAKTSKALSRLGESMRERKWQKTYRVKTDVIPREKEGVLEHFLVHDEYKARIAPEGKKSRLSYKVHKDGFIEIELETGRYHQIRAQFAAIGCPVIGDEKYGSRQKLKEGILLQHVTCSFPHPISRDMLTIQLSNDLIHPLMKSLH